MKRVIRQFDIDSQFIPDKFDDTFVSSIIDSIKTQIDGRYGRRFKKMEIDAEEIEFDDTHMQARIIVYNNGSAKANRMFEFDAYDEYWDKDDFDQHVNVSTNKFVENLV